MSIKKILAIIGFVAFIVFVSWSLYWVFFRDKSSTVTDDPGFIGGTIPGVDEGVNIIEEDDPDENQGLPWQQLFKDKISEVANGGLTAVTKLSEGSVAGLQTTEQGIKYYDESKDQFFRINDQGQPELITDKKFYEVDNVLWSPKDDKAILEYPDGMNVLYNFRTGEQVTLPAEMEDFSFKNSGYEIAAAWIGPHSDDNWIVTANDDGSGLGLIEPLGDQQHNTDIGYSPDSQVVALHRKSVDLQRQEVFPIGLHGENLRSFVVQGSGFTSEWSPAGDSLLYSIYNESTDYLPNLWVTNGQTNNLGDVKVSLNLATWPDKCNFSSENSLYCAVPQGLPRGAGLYPEIADNYTDNFYHIDLNTGTKTLIASPVGESGAYTAYNLFVSNDGSMLYFTDQSTGRLQSIRLQ
jgi:hypothetical protein